MALCRWMSAAGLAILAYLAGCGHAHTTDAARSDSREKQDEQQRAEPTARRASVEHDARRPDADHGVPLATSPEGLLRPGAEDKIRDKLAAGGFLENDAGSVRAGLLRFQREHDLPATGAPDGATLRKLGLDPDQLLRKAAPAPSESKSP